MFGTRESEDHLQIIGIFQISPGVAVEQSFMIRLGSGPDLFGQKLKICPTTSIDCARELKYTYLYYVISIYSPFIDPLKFLISTCFVIAIAFQVYIFVTQRNPCALPNRTHRIISHDCNFCSNNGRNVPRRPSSQVLKVSVVRCRQERWLAVAWWQGIHVQRDTNETGTQLRYLHVVKGLGCEEFMKRQKRIPVYI